MSGNILHIDSSARHDDSLSRQVTAYVAEHLATRSSSPLVYRDLLETDLAFLDEQKIQAYFTAKEERSRSQQALLETSDALVAELKDAKTLIIGAPMYNFSIAASLKAWIDLVCRVGETFVYTEQGPKGLVGIERAFIVVSTGGVAVGSEVDFVSPLLTQVCHFLGVDEVHIIDASGSKREAGAIIESAKEQIDQLLAA